MCPNLAVNRRIIGIQAVRHPHTSPPLRDAKIGDSLVKLDLSDPLPVRIGDRPVALDIADDLPVIVADLHAPPVARIVDIPDPLAVGVSDRVGLRSLGEPALAELELTASGSRDHGQREHQGQGGDGEDGCSDHR